MTFSVCLNCSQALHSDVLAHIVETSLGTSLNSVKLGIDAKFTSVDSSRIGWQTVTTKTVQEPIRFDYSVHLPRLPSKVFPKPVIFPHT